MKTKIIIALFLGLISTAAFSQTSWYVSEYGDDTNGDGSATSPWATITKAMGENLVIDGDTINIEGAISQDGDAEYGIQVLKDLVFKGVFKETSIIEASSEITSADRRVFTIWDVAEVKFMNLTIRNGYLDAYSFQSGAGILNWGNLFIENCIVEHNYNDNENLGGGIYNQYGSTFISNTYVHSNYSYNGGAGIVVEGGDVAIENSSFALNYAQKDLAGGGAIYITNAANVSIINSTLYYNLLGLNSFGAGIYLKSDDGDINLEIINSTIADNEAAANSFGNGIYIDNETSNIVNVLLKNVIISNGNLENFGQNGSGIININRTHTLCKDASLPYGGINSNLDNTDPQIETFLNHGGLTPTCSIGEFSPAVNAGIDEDVPEIDQRGFPRCGLPDIGSFEYQSTAQIANNERSSFEIFPNPATSLLNVDLKNSDSKSVKATLLNSLGEKVKSFENNNITSRFNIQVSDLKPGIYFLNIVVDGKFVETTKVIIR